MICAGFALKYREVAKLRASSPTPKIKALDREAIIEGLKLHSSSQCASSGETRIGESSQYCNCKDHSTINENIEHERGYPRRGGPYYLSMKMAMKTTIFRISGLFTKRYYDLDSAVTDRIFQIKERFRN